MANVNIEISQNGRVTGDRGMIIGYEDQCISEPIHIIHPQFSGVQYILEYRYTQTICREPIDSNGHATIKIQGPGYVQCQFIAIDVMTGNNVFRSNSWNFIIRKALRIEPSHYPCQAHQFTSHNHGCNCGKSPCTCNCNCNSNDFDAFTAFWKLQNEIRNESDIRFSEIQEINAQLQLINDALKLDEPTPSILDANRLINPGTFASAIGSINFPDDINQFKITVSSFDNSRTILQNAAEIDADNIWFRTGTQSNISSIDYDWTGWAPLITRTGII